MPCMNHATGKDPDRGCDLQIKKGNEVYFSRILIAGNNKTRDKVIRRQLSIWRAIYTAERLK